MSVGDKAISELTTNFVARAPLTEKTIAWRDRFVGRYRRPPIYTAAGAYDAVLLYADAIERAGSTDTDALVKALEATDFVGAGGRVTFDPTHDVMHRRDLVNQLFVQWQQNGKRAVIWPKTLAAGAMINPPWMAGKSRGSWVASLRHLHARSAQRDQRAPAPRSHDRTIARRPGRSPAASGRSKHHTQHH